MQVLWCHAKDYIFEEIGFSWQIQEAESLAIIKKKKKCTIQDNRSSAHLISNGAIPSDSIPAASSITNSIRHITCSKRIRKVCIIITDWVFFPFFFFPVAAFLVASSSELIGKFFSFLNYSPRENLLKYVDLNLNEISLKTCKKNNIYFKCFFITEKKVKKVFPSY